MSQELLFDVGLPICDLFIGHPIETRSAGDRCRAAQLALLTVLLKSRSGKATADDIVRDRSKPYADGGKWLGRCIAQLAEDGLIRSCGARNSGRSTRNAGLLREWELADRDAARLKVKRLKRSLTFRKESDSTAATAEPEDSQSRKGSKERTDG